jgi:hypothetical protein
VPNFPQRLTYVRNCKAVPFGGLGFLGDDCEPLPRLLVEMRTCLAEGDHQSRSILLRTPHLRDVRIIWQSNPCGLSGALPEGDMGGETEVGFAECAAPAP